MAGGGGGGDAVSRVAIVRRHLKWCRPSKYDPIAICCGFDVEWIRGGEAAEYAMKDHRAPAGLTAEEAMEALGVADDSKPDFVAGWNDYMEHRE